MDESTAVKLQGHFNQVWRSLCGPDFDHDRMYAVVQELAERQGAAFGHVLYAVAYYLFGPELVDEIGAERLYESYRKVDTEKKMISYLASCSEEQVRAIEGLIQTVKDVLPVMRSALLSKGKTLPHRTSGGRPSKMPSEEVRHQIRQEIGKLIVAGVKTGDAQQRIATRHNLSKRCVERIWQQRTKHSNDR